MAQTIHSIRAEFKINVKVKTIGIGLKEVADRIAMVIVLDINTIAMEITENVYR